MSYYSIIVEWDGKKPPTTFYNRMKRLGFKVRGDKNMTPMERRANKDGSTIPQEGTIKTSSQSLAKVIATYARELGARAVLVETVEVSEELNRMTVEDARVIRRIEEIAGRRGRHISEPHDVTVTCVECGDSTEVVEVTEDVIQCPKCMGVKLAQRTGKRPKFAESCLSNVSDIYSLWLLSRFSNHRFEVPIFDSAVKKGLPKTVEITLSQEKSTATHLAVGIEYGALVKSGKAVNEVLRMMDSIFCSRISNSYETRRRYRIEAITAYLSAGNAMPADLSLAEKVDSVDIFDLIKMKPDFYALYFSSRTT